MLNVRDYGAVGDGITDDTAAILNALAAAPARGDEIDFPSGQYLISSPIVLQKPVTLKGFGSSVNMNNGNDATYLPATEILWAGPQAGPVIQFAYAADGKPLAGAFVRDLSVNLQGQCSLGIEMIGSQHCGLDNVGVRNPSGGTVECTALWMHAKTDEPNATVDCTHNLIQGFFASVVSRILLMDGNALQTANCSHNTFVRTSGVFGLNGSALNGIELAFCDNNDFFGTFMYRQSGATGYGVNFADLGTGNCFYHLEASSGGVHSAAHPSGGNNTIFGYDRGNNQPAPVIDAGSLLSWTEDGANSAGWHIDNPLYLGGGNRIAKVLTGSATYDPPTLTSKTQTNATMSLPGVLPGDHVIPSFSSTLQAITLTAYVSAADSVTFVFWNGTGNSVNLPSGTLAAIVLRR